MTGGERVTAQVQVTAATVRRDDIIVVGGQPLQVADMVTMPSGGKRLIFVTGETLTLRQSTELTATRTPAIRPHHAGRTTPRW